jgi:hypothetical protein
MTRLTKPFARRCQLRSSSASVAWTDAPGQRNVVLSYAKKSSQVRPTGFEPVTLGSEDRCAIQLRHGRKRYLVIVYVAPKLSPVLGLWAPSAKRAFQLTSPPSPAGFMPNFPNYPKVRPRDSTRRLSCRKSSPRQLKGHANLMWILNSARTPLGIGPGKCRAHRLPS